MNQLPVTSSTALPAMSESAIGKVRAVEDELLEMPQVQIATDHVIHGGIYARTICIPAGVVLTGAVIKKATTLIVSGNVVVSLGDTSFELNGYYVLPASAGRKQAFIAKADTYLTMLFPTEAKSVEEAEAEFTDEVDRLFSRHGENFIRITGE